MSARDNVRKWMIADNGDALLDAYRDEVALDLGRDLLRDGLDAFLVRLVGAENAARVLADAIGPPLHVTSDGERCPRQGCRIRSAHAHSGGQA